ncbi:MAG TPA: tetratricopeptide repeat protein [Terriglobia bacterium]|nr:tetratricopeptide repeat protein [Terriglobia bacterium]
MGGRTAERASAFLTSRLLCGFSVLFLPAAFALGQKTGQPSQSTSKSPAAEASAAFNALLSKATAAREADHTDEAIRLYQQVVRAKPDDPEGWWYLGTLYYESDQYSDGRIAFRHVTGLKPGVSLGWAMLGLCEFETRDYDSALEHLERADALGIPHQESYYDVARYHLALLLTRAGRFDAATVVLADFAAHGDENPKFTEAMGLAGLHKPLLPSELRPDEREMVLDVGKALCDDAAKRATDIAKDRLELLRKYPDTPEIHFVAGILALASDSDQALEDWKSELKISPDHPRALVSIAAEYRRRSEFKEALPYAEKAVAASPGEFVTHAVLGEVLAEGDLDVPRAIHELQIAVRLNPSQPQVHFALGAAYAKAGRKEEAAKERAQFLRLRDPSEAGVAKPQ